MCRRRAAAMVVVDNVNELIGSRAVKGFGQAGVKQVRRIAKKRRGVGAGAGAGVGRFVWCLSGLYVQGVGRAGCPRVLQDDNGWRVDDAIRDVWGEMRIGAVDGVLGYRRERNGWRWWFGTYRVSRALSLSLPMCVCVCGCLYECVWVMVLCECRN